LIAAAIVASSARAASAQAFSSGWGTGNVQWTHYDSAGKLVLDNSQKNSIVRVDRGQNSVVRINRGNGALSSFASVPAGDAGAITVPGGSIGYNELLATH
jgi:hypothetical protein